MKDFYFPREIYVEAIQSYVNATGLNIEDVGQYCMENLDFFVEIAFSYVDGIPAPKMKAY